LMIIAFQKMPNKCFKTQSDYLLVYKPIGVLPRCDYVLTRTYSTQFGLVHQKRGENTPRATDKKSTYVGGILILRKPR
jgi:hypothetical protein